MPIDPKPSPLTGSNKTRQGWIAKCGHFISNLSLRDNEDKTEDDPNRLVTRSAKAAGGKRKRTSPQSIRAKPSFKMESKPPVSEMTNGKKELSPEEKEEKMKASKTRFDSAINETDIHTHYNDERKKLLTKEETVSWDRAARESATETENIAAEYVRKIREYERDIVFGNIASEDLPGPHTLDMGGQFLTNKHRIDKKSLIFKIAQHMPKGAIQHLHFNAELHPERLLEEARSLETMFIQSKRALLNDKDLELAELVFKIESVPTKEELDEEEKKLKKLEPIERQQKMVQRKEEEERHNIFSEKYHQEGNQLGLPMKWSDFRAEFAKRFPHICSAGPRDWSDAGPNGSLTDSSVQGPVDLEPAEQWIRSKMVLSEEEAYGISQSVNGVWARFNQATRCFKGLLNYDTIYKWYIGKAIDRMIEERVMYAELRPMLMDKTIPSKDGLSKLSHDDQMNLIINCVKEKQDELDRAGLLHKFPFGLKIIYCTPRSIGKKKMRAEMEDCINLKIKFPNLICGFDLVGAEDRANHIGFYREELVSFMKTCDLECLDIPFMFHAGETLLDTGGSKDPQNSNLYEAVLLNSKRIGHGFSLMKHPKLIEEFKKKNICIELCPISNELLHLCRNVKEHPFPQLLAAGIPCTVNSDNPSLFSNSMSHEFYQVMVGTPTMTLHGWRQLAEWSLDYSRLSDEEKRQGREILGNDWEKFCEWIVSTYGAFAECLDGYGKPMPNIEVDRNGEVVLENGKPKIRSGGAK